MDAEFNFLWVNRAYAEADEKDVSYFPGKNHFDLFPNEENKRLFRKVVETDIPIYKEAKAFEYAAHPERGLSYWDWSLVPIKDTHAHVIVLVLTVQNVTKRVHAERALRKSEVTLAKAQKIAKLGSWDWDVQTNELYWSDEMYKIFGIKRGAKNLLEMVLEMIHPEDRIIYEKAMADAFKGQAPPSLEYRIVVGKRIKHIRGKAEMFYDNSGQFISMVGTAQDITVHKEMAILLEKGKKRLQQEAEELQNTLKELKKAQEQLIQSEKLASIGYLAAGVAHEINNPIMGIINYAQILLDELKEYKNIDVTAKPFSFIAGIIREGDRISKIVQNLLSFGRQDEEKFAFTDLSEVIKTSISLMSSQFKIFQIELHLSLEKNLPTMFIKKYSIQQVLLNLFQNSIDALNEKFEDPIVTEMKKISIETSLERKGNVQYGKIIVKDNGQGIKQNNLKKIFDPFFTTKQKKKNTNIGLGLSVSFGIIEDHKGKIYVRSNWKKGTAVEILLPIKP